MLGIENRPEEELILIESGSSIKSSNKNLLETSYLISLRTVFIT